MHSISKTRQKDLVLSGVNPELLIHRTALNQCFNGNPQKSTQ